MVLSPGPSRVNTFAGYFLVIAHAFYGLNFLNMWPCFLAPLLYVKIRHLRYNENLHICMLCTCFSPFISELLFRYSLGDKWAPGMVHISGKGILLTLLEHYIPKPRASMNQHMDLRDMMTFRDTIRKEREEN